MNAVTIVIPTRERCETLVQTLETCIAQTEEQLCIRVSDNASTDDTREVVAEFQRRDSRVEYVNPGRRVGMSENWEFALRDLRKGWVMVIGDDDGVLPGGIRRFFKALKTLGKADQKVAAVQWTYSVFGYENLPAYQPGVSVVHNGWLMMRVRPGLELRDGPEWLRKVADGRAGYMQLPRLYHGLVRTTVLDSIRRRAGGRLIHSITPDAFTALALGAHVGSFLHLYQPVSINGVSPKSTGHSVLMTGAGRSEISDGFVGESEIGFHPSIPYVRRVQILTAESLLRCQDAGLLPEGTTINWQRFISRTYLELERSPLGEEYREEQCGILREIETAVGCDGLIDRLAAGFIEEELRSTLWEGTIYDFKADLSPLKPGGIANVCRLARLLCQTADGLCPPEPPVQSA